MKKLMIILTVALASMMMSNTYAALPELTSQAFAKGDMVGSLSVGYGWGFSQRLALEYGVADGWLDGRASLGVGGAIGNCFSSYSYWGVGYTQDQLGLTANCAFHYQFIDKLDTYVQIGLGLGYAFYSWTDSSLNDYYGSAYDNHIFFDFTSCLGARYYFTPKFGANLELGYTAGSYIMAGVTLKF